MTVFAKLAAVVALALAPVAATSAPIDLVGAGYVDLAPGATPDASETSVFATIAGGTLSAGNPVTLSAASSGLGGVTDPSTYTLTLQSVSVDPLTMAPTISLLQALPGSGTAYGFTTPDFKAILPLGSVEVLFKGVSGTGSFALFDGRDILMRVTDIGLDAPNDSLLTLGNGRIDLYLLEPIPLPAGALLLLTGAGALVVARRRKAG